MSEHMHAMTRRAAVAVVGLALCGGVVAGAQAPAPAARPAAAQPPAAQAPAAQAPAVPGAAPAPPTAPAAPAQEGAYVYNPAGRRDPFVSLLGRGTDATKSSGTRPAGVPGLLINEVSIKGIIRDRSGFIAMVQGADNKTYVVRAGDRLMDGTVKAIVQDAVVFSQDVNDPLSLVKQKEVRKNLRSTEGGRG